MEETFELRNKLCEISTKIEEYKTAHKDLLTTKQEYIDLREEKPEKRSEKEPRKPLNTKIPKLVIVGVLLLALIFAGITCIVGVSTVLFWFVSVPALAFCFIFLLISFISALLLLGEIIYTNIAKKKYQEGVKTCEANRNYNEKEYPELSKRYERVSQELALEYEEVIKNAKLHIDEIEAYFKENSQVINKKYYNDIDRIITVLDEQRATRLSDAINLVLRDKRIERTSGKQKKIHHHEEELYPKDIMQRALVLASNCARCQRKDSCVRLYCQMNEHFKKKEEENKDPQLKIKELPTRVVKEGENGESCSCKCVCTCSEEKSEAEKSE